MNESNSLESEPLPESLGRLVNEACDRFEGACKRSERPRIEDFLSDASEPVRSVLARELILLEIYYARLGGAATPLENYRDRFPELDATWLADAVTPVSTVDLPEFGASAPTGSVAAETSQFGSPLPAADSECKVLGGSVAGVPRVHLREPRGEPLTPVIRPSSTEGSSGQDQGVRFRIDGEIARGGMGAILKGRDTALGREIAVKVLLETHQGKAELAQRFLEEAQIAGQLQHPGIVPVYDLGVFPDKRPYFTMKLVKGKTLAALLTARKNIADEQAKFVGIFAQVCQTLAYAHARGVIHRDLKPSNVMVGNFGEVQVMDWGLAKVLREGGVADEREAQTHEIVSVIRTRQSGSSDPPEIGLNTQAGSVLGTPAYMAPEQARGEQDLVDARADVFGLGAILCEVLTGQPPFAGTKTDALRKAHTAQLDDAFRRLDGCGADAELIGLARRCLAAEPWDRPRDSGEIANEVTTYQNSVAERLRQAELAHAAELARTEEAQATAAQERRARRLTVGLATVVLLLIAVGALGTLAIQQRWADRSAAESRRRQEIESALNKAQDLRQQARWVEARAVLEQARNLLGDEEHADLRHRLDLAGDDLNLVDRVEIIRLRSATVINNKFDDRTADRDYAAVFREHGLGEEGEEAEAVAARVRDSAVREQLVAALDNWAEVTKDLRRQAWLLEVARRADPDAWRDRFRDPEIWRNRAALEALAGELLSEKDQLAKQKPQLLTLLGAALQLLEADAVPLLSAAQARHPDDFWLNLDLGNALTRVKQAGAAAGYSRAALAARPKAAAAHNNLGNALVEQKQLDAAIAEYRIALELDPLFGSAHNNLGSALDRKKELDEAIREFRIAIDLDATGVAAHANLGSALGAKGLLDEAIRECQIAIKLDPENSTAHNNFGNALLEKNQLDEAIREFGIAVELDPKDASPHNNLARALRAKNEVDEAIRECRVAIKLDPKLAVVHYNLATGLLEKKQLDEAIREFHTAIDLDHQDPRPHNNLGNALSDRKQLDEAVREYRAAIKLDPKLAHVHDNLALALHKMNQLDEAIREFRIAIEQDSKNASVHVNLGSALGAKGMLDEAIREFRTATELDAKDRRAHFKLGSALFDKKELDEAIRELRKAIDIDFTYVDAHVSLGAALSRKGRREEAIRELRTAIELNPEHALAHFNLGTDLVKQGKQDEAIREFLTAIKLDPKDATAHNNVAIALLETGQVDEAIKHYRVGIELQPQYAEVHCGLGHALVRKGAFAEALAELRKGHELGSKKPGWPYPSSDWVRNVEHLVQLERRLPAILEGNDKPADNAECLLLAQMCQEHKKLYAASARFFSAAFEALPELAKNPRNGQRYNAACVAALAGCGQGKDADKLDDKERALLRNRALEWLRADLGYWTKQAESNKANDRALVEKTLRHWQEDADLAGIRDEAAVAKLAEGEQEACKKLWADVEAVLKMAHEKEKQNSDARTVTRNPT
jgi:serine/threonine-protein kinase